MKKVMILASLSLLLASCNSNKTTPTASVNLSGNWTSTAVQAGYTNTLPVVIKQTSINAAGDYSGTIELDGDLANLSGNIYQGTLNVTATGDEASICKGAFSNNYTKYVGRCPGGTTDFDLTMTKN